jgi:Putative Ig domain
MIAALIILALQTVAQTQTAAPATGAPLILRPAVLQQRYVERLPVPPSTLAAPWQRRMTRGSLPPGLQFDSHELISGTPTREGTFQFEITTTDSSIPPRTIRESFVLVVENGLTIRWTNLPNVDSDRISGEVEVENETSAPVDLTVIIVAVNEIGKAFALGYQHFNIAPGMQKISFGSTLPRGNYIIHADAIGEIAVRITIYRARLQTPSPSTVP